ncbi:MAG: hypothetical protein GY788_01325 [bacterium]|nr:hypothetical protein [bacterium]
MELGTSDMGDLYPVGAGGVRCACFLSVPTTFVDDDQGYIWWRDSHPPGFVINHDRTPSKRYLVLHRASCGTMSGEPARGRSWTHAYGKTCSDSVSELLAWSRAATGEPPRACGICQPPT